MVQDLGNAAFVITGASGAVGRMIAQELLSRGAYLLLQTSKSGQLDDLQTERSIVSINNWEHYDAEEFFAKDAYRFIELIHEHSQIRGIFHAIGIPARITLSDELTMAESAQAMGNALRISTRINVGAPLQMTSIMQDVYEHSPDTFKCEPSLVFLSSQHTLSKPSGKQPYYEAKALLEKDASLIATLYHISNVEEVPHWKVTTLLPGNLGVGMSAGARLRYEAESSLVDLSVFKDACLEALLNPPYSGRRVLITAQDGCTTQEVLPPLP